jgi:hypothetical protein
MNMQPRKTTGPKTLIERDPDPNNTAGKAQSIRNQRERIGDSNEGRRLFLEIVVIGRSNRSGQLSKGSAKVFQLFLRARANNYFKARSAGRDTETDQARAASVFRSIEDALDGAKAEQAGLKSRIDDVLARAAVTLGNDSDEYLTRDPEDNYYQSLLNTEIANGQRRLNELGVTIGHFQFLKTALITRFSRLQALDTTFPARRIED